MLLEVRDLKVCFNTADGVVEAVRGLGFSMARAETLGLVGESGSGKSQTARAILGLLASNGRAQGGVRFKGREILNAPARQLARIRGAQIAMIFQDPMTSLNPYLRVSTQMTEVLMQHRGMSYRGALKRCVQMLEAVRIPDAGKRVRRYPHEFSGGMRQRIMIAMALLCEPDLLIADEPTTALDVTVQAQILALLEELKKEFHLALLLITHDLGVVAGICDHVLVMYGGRLMEYGAVRDIFHDPRHPYSRGLLSSMPRLDAGAKETLASIPGNPPDPLRLPAGCPFFERCSERLEVCRTETPPLVAFAGGRKTACHREPIRL